MKALQAFARPTGVYTTYLNNGYNVDIRNYMEKLFPKAVKNCINVDALFKGKNELETAKMIWLFLRKYSNYVRDSSSEQKILLPSQFVKQKGNSDCKSFATFARAVYASIYPDLETAFKFTAYYPESKQPSHVYCVVKDKQGNEIIIDGCWTRFNNEKNYTLALPLNFKTMRITSLADDLTSERKSDFLDGINNNATALQRQRLAKLARLRNEMRILKRRYDFQKLHPKEYQAQVFSIQDEINGIYKKLTPEQKRARKKRNLARFKKGWLAFARANATIALAPIRGAFIAVIALNINALASKLQKLINAKKFDGVLKIWKNVGGIEKLFKKAIAKGAKRKPLFLSKKAKAKYKAKYENMAGYHSDADFIGDIEGIGIAPAIVAAIAVPVITAIVGAMGKAFSSMGKKGKVEAQELAEEGAQMMQQDNRANLNNALNDSIPSEGQQEMQPEPQQENEMNGINANTFDWGGLIESAAPLLKFGAEKVMQKASKNPKLQKVLMKGGEVADDYMTGRYVRQAGYKNAWQTASSGFDKFKIPLIAGGVAVLGFGAYLLGKKK